MANHPCAYAAKRDYFLLVHWGLFIIEKLIWFMGGGRNTVLRENSGASEDLFNLRVEAFEPGAVYCLCRCLAFLLFNFWIIAPMDVYYQRGRSWNQSPQPISGVGQAVVLSYNNWDDYTFKTTLNGAVFSDGKAVYEFAIRILIDGVKNTAEYLDALSSAHWDGKFPIPNARYISLPNNIDFYEVLISVAQGESAKNVVMLLHDAGCLSNWGTPEEKELVSTLITSETWSTSLLREAGSKKSFEDGWRAFERSSPRKIHDFTLNLPRQNGTVQPVNFAFDSDLLPYDINILIGPNGVGKSYCLKTLVEFWLGVGSGDSRFLNGYKTFDVHPNLSKLILVSYSPFEEFALDLGGTTLQDKEIYKYFGFRYQVDDDGARRVGISRNLPAQDSVSSLIKALRDDNAFSFLTSWVSKLKMIREILGSAISFDALALELSSDYEISPLDGREILEANGFKYYIPHAPVDLQLLESVESHIVRTEGVIFLKDGNRVQLSSGQRLFCYIVINVVGEIKQDSLVIIDEPELFLHPKLEVEFVGLLKHVNRTFNSCAILATHSLSIARETPSKCCHVFRNLEDGLDVVHPPFQTFGGDMQRISTYVFGDDSFSKPFDRWIDEQLKELDDPKMLISRLGSQVNEELVIKILNSGKRHGRQDTNS